MPSATPVRVAIDIETTGLQVESDSIIEIGAVQFRGTEILATFETFVEPRRTLPYRIQRLTHITPAMLVGAPAFGTIAPTLRTLLGDAPLVGHSVGFDATFLRKMHLAERNALLDTFELASLLLPTLSSYSLDSVAAHLGLSAPNHHRALADAILARDVLLALEARIADLPDQILIDLCELATPTVLPSSILLRQERTRRGIAGGSSASFGAALNDKLRMNPAVLNLHVATLAAPAPALVAPAPAAAVPAEDAATEATVTALLNDQAIGMVELAPPLTSSDAAVLPALRWARASGQRLVIAAASAAAVRVLAERLPLLLGASGSEPLRVATLLEPHEYLCLHRWYGPARTALAPNADALRGFAKLTVWAHGTAAGARDEVTLGPTENGAWETVRGGTTFEAMPGCAYRERGWCFGRRARDAAAEAQIVLTTHAALFAANPTLPRAAGYLLLDAHQLEDGLMAQAADGVEADHLRRTLDWLWQRDGQGAGGLLAQAVRAIPGDTGQNWGSQVTKAREALRAFFTALTALPAEALAQARQPANNEGAPLAVRLDGSARSLAGWGVVADAWRALEKRLNAVSEGANTAQRLLAKVRGSEALAQELAARQEELRQIVRWGRECMDQPRDHMVYWIRPAQTNMRPNPRGRPQPPAEEFASLQGAPSHAAHLAGPALRALGVGVVLAGSALTVEGRFDDLAERLGLAPLARTATVPCDFRHQTLLLIPSDAPEPNMPAYQRALNDALVQVAATLQGNTVALFASHTALRTTYNTIKPLLEQRDILVLAQGIDGSLRQMWQNYRSQDRIVLLGAGGMWEGWESDGARAQCLFIPRLPLPALGDPAIAARAERHSDHMRQFTVPHAALRLRQAMNRLAWAHTNRNVVVLYDCRVITKDYGATILNTLPPLTLREASVTMLGTTAQEWLNAPMGE